MSQDISGYGGQVVDADDTGKALASRQVADDLAKRIESGEYEVGATLPTYRQLAGEYDVAVNTAMTAVRLLRERGFVTAQRNASARVRDRSADVDTSSALRSIQDEVAALRSELAQAEGRLAQVERNIGDLADRSS